MSSALIKCSPISALPNEILLCILAEFSSPDLLQWIATSHRFASLICRIIRSRMFRLTASDEQKILLELYPPSGKYSEPLMYCTYVGTPGLDDLDDSYRQDCSPSSMREIPYHLQLTRLRDLYTIFSPARDRKDPSLPDQPHPAGDVPGSRTHPSSSTQPKRYATTPEEQAALVRKVVHVDSHELFTQLCANISLIRDGPRKGLYTSLVKVDEGFMRLFRSWLSDRAKEELDKTSIPEDSSSPNETLEGLELKDDTGVMWLGLSKDVGFRFGVNPVDIRHERPVVLLPGEDPPVSYEIEYRELLIRTSRLLLKSERSLQQLIHNNRTIVIEGFQ